MAAVIHRLRWAVVIVDLDSGEGHEQAGQRRALVVSYEPFHRSGLVTVCPITAARADPRYPGEVPLREGEAGQSKPGVVMCGQIRTISSSRIVGEPLGHLAEPRTKAAIRRSLAHHLGLDVPSVLDGAA